MKRSGTDAGSPPGIYFDFVDPLSWVVSQALDRLEAGSSGAEGEPGGNRDRARLSAEPDKPGLAWVGFELAASPWAGIDPRTPGWRARCAKAREWAEGANRWAAGLANEPQASRWVAAPAGEAAHLPWTRKAHELCEMARGRGAGVQFRARKAVFDAHFREGRDIGRIDVLVALAEQVGLDRTEVKAALDVDHFTDAVAAARKAALRLGVRDVPAVVRPYEDGVPRAEAGSAATVAHLAESRSFGEIASVIGRIAAGGRAVHGPDFEPKERS